MGILGLGAGTLPVFDRYIKANKPTNLIFFKENGKAYSERSLQEVVKIIASKAGVAKKLTPTQLCHTQPRKRD
ncbi:MAG: hypothetical protein Q8J88_04230 [Bacteroidales bacterium]|nr:hypothetical protein [Bacteroidales bacterium]